MITLEEALERLDDPARIESVAEIIALLSEEDREFVLEGVDHDTFQYDWNIWGRPKQLIPDDPYYNIHLLLAGRGAGKLIRLDTPILQADGTWKLNGDLQPGDRILTEEGLPTTVTQVHPIQVPETAYRLHFSDGTHLDAGGEHLWATWTARERKQLNRTDRLDYTPRPEVGFPSKWAYDESHVRSTQEIVDTLYTSTARPDRNHAIPLTLPIPFNRRDDLPISPYLLGYWLGDGNSSAGNITTHVDDLPNLLNAVVSAGYTYSVTTTGQNPNVKRVRVCGFTTDLKSLNLYKNKHIPQAYLTASIEQRQELLAGLIDSDGCIALDRPLAEFCSVIPRLSGDVTHLLRTLGEKPVTKQSASYLYGVRHRDRYRTHWRPKFNPFRLPRKADRYVPLTADSNQALRNFHRMIVSAEPIDPVPMRCITVDNPTGLYLAGEGLIVTHNTRTMSEWVREKAKTPNTRIALMGRTQGETRDILVTGESGILSIPQPPSDKPTYKPSEGRVVWPNGSQAKILSAETPDSVRGSQHSYAVVDELASHTPFTDGAGLTAFQNLRIATRLGEHPTLVCATTPKSVPVLRDLLEESKDPKNSIRVVQGSTMENAANLSASYMNVILGTYEGTSLAKQELLGEMLDEDPEGVLWTPEMVNQANLTALDPSTFYNPLRIIAVDPSVAEEPDDECGIIAFTASQERAIHQRRGAVLGDYSLKASPEVWAREVVRVYHLHKARGVLVEGNQGRHLLQMAIHSVDPTVKVFTVNAHTSKKDRALPVSLVYQQGRVSHARAATPLTLLETQQTTWEPGVTRKSPDRVDALVHAVTGTMLLPRGIPGLSARPARARVPQATLPTGFRQGLYRPTPTLTRV